MYEMNAQYILIFLIFWLRHTVHMSAVRLCRLPMLKNSVKMAYSNICMILDL